MTRRLIPPVAALVAMAFASVPAWAGEVADARANRWTIGLIAIASGMLVPLFAWMRHRMAPDGDRHLTRFGLALYDFFRALILFFLAKFLFWGSFWWVAYHGDPLARWQVIALRAGLVGGSVYLLGTGFSVGWEMGRPRIGPRMTVHAAQGEGGYDGPERRSGNDRRKGWGKQS